MCLFRNEIFEVLTKRQPTLSFDESEHTIMIYHKMPSTGKFYGYSCLEPCPGNAHALFSTDSHIYHDFQGQGLGITKNQELIDIVKEAGYTSFLCTVNHDNTKQLRILKKNGWQRLGSISETASIYIKEL